MIDDLLTRRTAGKRTAEYLGKSPRVDAASSPRHTLVNIPQLIAPDTHPTQQENDGMRPTTNSSKVWGYKKINSLSI